MSLYQVWRYFRPKKTIRPLPRHLVAKFNILDLDYDVVAALQTARAKDPTEVKRLMKRYNVTSGYDLIDKLPPRKKTPLIEKIWTLLRRLEGSTQYPLTIHQDKRKAARLMFRTQYRYREPK